MLLTRPGAGSAFFRYEDHKLTPSAGMRGSEFWFAARASMLHPSETTFAKCANEDALNLADAIVLRIPHFTEIGTTARLIKAFGGRDAFVAAVHDLQSALYREVA